MACSPGTFSDQGSRHANGAFHSMRTRARVPFEWGCALADSPPRSSPAQKASRRELPPDASPCGGTGESPPQPEELSSWTASAASVPSLMAGGALPKHRCRRPQQRQCPWSRLEGCSGRSRTFKNHTVILRVRPAYIVGLLNQDSCARAASAREKYTLCGLFRAI